MRLVVINHKDFCLFGDQLGTTTYSFFNRHRPTFERMMEDQGHLFWRRYLVSFKAHCMENELIANPWEKGNSYRYLVLEGFNYLEMQILHWSKATTRTKAFIDDVVVLANFRHLLNALDTKKRTKDPFCVKECRDVFRKVFGGETGLGAFARVRAWVFCPIYLQMAASLCMTLRRWMDAEGAEIDSSDHSYWEPPPCDMFLHFSFSDEVYKLLPNQVDPNIPEINRKEMSRLDREKFGAEMIDQFKAKLGSDSGSRFVTDKKKGQNMFTLTKPGCCISLEVTTLPDEASRTLYNPEHGITSFKIVQLRYHTSGQYLRWKPVNNAEKVENAVNSVLDLLTNEERKRFHHGLLAEKERRKQTDDPPPENPLLNYLKDYTAAMTAIHECENPRHEKPPYVFKRCSQCDKVEQEKRSFKVCKICHDRGIQRARCYCSRDCQVLDWRRHREEHMEIERIKSVIEDDHPDRWVDEFDRFSAGYFRVREPDTAPPQCAKERSAAGQADNRVMW